MQLPKLTLSGSTALSDLHMTDSAAVGSSAHLLCNCKEADIAGDNIVKCHGSGFQGHTLWLPSTTVRLLLKQCLCSQGTPLYQPSNRSNTSVSGSMHACD